VPLANEWRRKSTTTLPPDSGHVVLALEIAFLLFCSLSILYVLCWLLVMPLARHGQLVVWALLVHTSRKGLANAAEMPTASLDPSASPLSTGWWKVTSGKSYCKLTNGGACVTNDGAGDYGNVEACTVRAGRDLVVSATSFDVESCCDKLTVGSRQYSGTDGPQNVLMAAGRRQSNIARSPPKCHMIIIPSN